MTSDITLSLVSHTNAGKTTLARTLLARDIGEVRDAPHVTEASEMHELAATPEGDRLLLWDTPGFGDSARLVRRLRQAGNPLGWFLSQVWDRWRDRPFWASQQALRHVQAESDVVLYLVNAAEPPGSAGYVASEMELLAWLGKPVLVLLNQLGAPRPAADEAAEQSEWHAYLARWPLVKAVLPLDAFARHWLHERRLLDTVQGLLPPAQQPAMQRLAAAWLSAREATFAAAMAVLAASVARCAAAREALDEPGGVAGTLRRFTATLSRDRDEPTPAAQAQARLAAIVQREVHGSTERLIALHGLAGTVRDEIIGRVAQQVALREKLPEGRAAVLGGAITGAITGLKADLLSGGLTLGGGLLAGGLLGALGAAGLARGINVLRDTGHSWVALDAAAMDDVLQAALLRYLAVAHFGRGRGDWVQGAASEQLPPHWPQVVADVLAAHRDAIDALWSARSRRFDNAGEEGILATRLEPVVAAAARATLERLHGQLPQRESAP